MHVFYDSGPRVVVTDDSSILDFPGSFFLSNVIWAAVN